MTDGLQIAERALSFATVDDAEALVSSEHSGLARTRRATFTNRP